MWVSLFHYYLPGLLRAGLPGAACLLCRPLRQAGRPGASVQAGAGDPGLTPRLAGGPQQGGHLTPRV